MANIAIHIPIFSSVPIFLYVTLPYCCHAHSSTPCRQIFEGSFEKEVKSNPHRIEFDSSILQFVHDVVLFTPPAIAIYDIGCISEAGV